MVKKYSSEDFVEKRCPHDCPFRDKLDFGIHFCSYAIYSTCIDPNRRTRTEVFEDGSVDYHVPPHCDIYELYKEHVPEIEKIKKGYDRHTLERRSHHNNNSKLIVTGEKSFRRKRR